MAKFKVEPKSRDDLRVLAKEIRMCLGIEDILYFPADRIMEIIHKIDSEAHFEVVEENELNEGDFATTDVISKTIKIRNDIYDKACEGDPFARMVIVHEFSHFITINVYGFELAMNIGKRKIPAYEDPEWQAKCLAGELMMPFDKMNGMSYKDIEQKCGVTRQAVITHFKVKPLNLFFK